MKTEKTKYGTITTVNLFDEESVMAMDKLGKELLPLNGVEAKFCDECYMHGDFKGCHIIMWNGGEFDFINLPASSLNFDDMDECRIYCAQKWNDMVMRCQAEEGGG